MSGIQIEESKEIVGRRTVPLLAWWAWEWRHASLLLQT